MILTFRKAQQKELFLTKCTLNVNLQPVMIQDVDHPLNYLNVYDAPMISRTQPSSTDWYTTEEGNAGSLRMFSTVYGTIMLKSENQYPAT